MSKISEKGFTLIELLTSIAIIGILSSFILVKVNTSKQNLNRAAQRLALDIRKAQNLALAPSEADNCIYGVYRKSGSSYSLYKRSKIQCNDNNYKYVNTGAGSTELETVSLPSGISWTGGGIRDVAFEGPEPITYLCVGGGNCSPSSSISDTIQLNPTTGSSKTITVNRFGMVEIQ